VGRVFAVVVAIRFQWWRDFPHPSRPTPRSTSLLYHGYRVSFPGVNGPGHGVNVVMAILRIIVMDSEMRPAHYDQLNLAFPKPPREEEETTMTMTTHELVSEFHPCFSNASCSVVLSTLQKEYCVLTPMFSEIYSVELPKI